jgi:ActR/RegA family two-component response regulator
MANNSPHILIFDDDRAYAAQLKETLRSIDENIKAVSTFEEFNTIDLSETKCLILDFYLREKEAKYRETALTVLKRLHDENPDIKVILHSGQAEVKDLFEASKIGIYRYIAKAAPNFRQKLVNTVKVILNYEEEPDNTPEEDPQREILRLNRLVEKLLNEREDEKQAEQYLHDLNNAHRKYIEGFMAVIKRVSHLCTNGQRPGILLDALLDDMIEHAGADKGAWIVLRDDHTIRDQNVERLKRITSSPVETEKVFGSALFEKVLNWSPSDPPIGPVDIASTQGRLPGIFQGQVLLCVFKYDQDELIFALEYQGESVNTSESTLQTYTSALQSMLDILPVYISVGEFGLYNNIAKFTERKVSTSQLLSRAFMSFLSLMLFWGAIISSLVAAAVLIASVFGFSKILEWDLHLRPHHYGVGVVNALEIFVLSITLYLLGIGLSCMIDNPRLRRVPPALRHLENPGEMKKSLALAVATLIAVAGLGFILDFPKDGNNLEWTKELAIFGSKILASVIFLLSLTMLLSEIDSRPVSTALPGDLTRHSSGQHSSDNGGI